MTSVRKSSLHRSERPDEDVKPVSVIMRILWVVVTAPFTLLSLVLAVGRALMYSAGCWECCYR